MAGAEESFCWACMHEEIMGSPAMRNAAQSAREPLDEGNGRLPRKREERDCGGQLRIRPVGNLVSSSRSRRRFKHRIYIMPVAGAGQLFCARSAFVVGGGGVDDFGDFGD